MRFAIAAFALLLAAPAVLAQTPPDCVFLECKDGPAVPSPSKLVGREFTVLCCGLNRDRGYSGVVIAQIDKDRVRVRVVNPICCVELLGNRQDACTGGRDVNSLAPGQELEIPAACVR